MRTRLALVLCMVGLAKGQDLGTTKVPIMPNNGSMTFALADPIQPPVFKTEVHPFSMQYFRKEIVTCDKSETPPEKYWDIIGVSDCHLLENATLDDVVNFAIQGDRDRRDEFKREDERIEYWRQKYLAELRDEIKLHKNILDSLDKMQSTVDAFKAKQKP